MTYKRFEEVPVWSAAIKLAEDIYAFTEAADQHLRTKASLKSQIERAALSVSNNIAEGFERGTTNELLSFLYIARGSAGEVRSMLCLMERLPTFRNFKSEISNLKSAAEGCSRQLRAWAEKLQNSEIRGPRHLNEKSKEADRLKVEQSEKEQEKAEFMEYVAKVARGEKVAPPRT